MSTGDRQTASLDATTAVFGHPPPRGVQMYNPGLMTLAELSLQDSKEGTRSTKFVHSILVCKLVIGDSHTSIGEFFGAVKSTSQKIFWKFMKAYI